jgi:hypothetical protein
MNPCKLSCDILNSINYKNDKIDNLFIGGEGDIDKNRELQWIEVREKKYILRIADQEDMDIKIRKFLEILYELKKNNTKYNDNAKYIDLEYMDSITFMLIAKELYKQDKEYYERTISPFPPSIYQPPPRPMQFEYSACPRSPIVRYKLIDDSKLRVIDDDINLENVLINLNILKEQNLNISQDIFDINIDRWKQIYAYNDHKEYIEPLPFILRDLDEKCCCNDHKYFNKHVKLTKIQIAELTYRNEMKFLKKFIYNTNDEIYMTIFDKSKRDRCDDCTCCETKTHQIKITQLYHLVKSCIIFETNTKNEDFLKENISNIFKKDNKKLSCNQTCNFKTVYECIIENLIKQTDSKQTEQPDDEDHYNHYKYIANIRDHIINNFETNLFPVFDKKKCPDLQITNFNPNMFFFDYEINKIISNIIENNKINYSFLKGYMVSNANIRDELGSGILKCLIQSYREFLKTWYKAELKMIEISDKIQNKSLISTITKSVSAGISILTIFLELSEEYKIVQVCCGIAAVFLGDEIVDRVNIVSEKELELLEKLTKFIKGKEFIYKNKKWDDSDHDDDDDDYGNHVQNRSTDDLFKTYVRTNKSEYDIRRLINFPDDVKMFVFNNSCRYVYYLIYTLDELNKKSKTTSTTGKKSKTTSTTGKKSKTTSTTGKVSRKKKIIKKK